MSILDILSIVGGLTLFLYGIQTLGEGLKKVSGGKMEQILQKLTSNKWKGALLGMLVTAVIQSSGATIVMVVGFVNSEIMTLRQAVGVILGANIGTTITAWLLSLTGITSDNIILQLFKPANFSPIIGIIGVFMMMMAKKDRQKQIGSIMTSFAVLMIGMNLMSTSASPLASNPAFTGLLTAFANPILGMLAGLVITVALQSSSASIGILQAISLTGTLKMGSAIPVLMGENIGSAITGILSSIGASRNARRTSLIQLFYCIIKTCTFMVLFYSLNAVIHFPIMDEIATPVSIAIFHSIFNIAAVLIVLPFSDLLVMMVERAIPISPDEKAASDTKKALQILDSRFIASPTFALEQCKAAAGKMADYTKEALSLAMECVTDYNDDKAARVDKLERIVDEYEDQLNTYLVKISGQDLGERDSRTFAVLMHCISDLERMTDHALNITEAAKEKRDKNMEFSAKAKAELEVFHTALQDIVNRAVTAFQNNNLKMAATVEPLEDVIDGINMEIKRRHVSRVRKGKCTIELGIVLTNITTDYERIADHCSNIAIYLLQTKEDGFDTHEFIERMKASDRDEFQKEVVYFEQTYRLPVRKEDDETAENDSEEIRTETEPVKPEKAEKPEKEAKPGKDKEKNSKDKKKSKKN